MNKNWRNVFLAFIKKELTETLHTMTPILLFSIVVTNVLQYVTMQNVMKHYDVYVCYYYYVCWAYLDQSLYV